MTLTITPPDMLLVVGNLQMKAVVDGDPRVCLLVYSVHVILELGSVPIVVLDERGDENVGVDHFVLNSYKSYWY